MNAAPEPDPTGPPADAAPQNDLHAPTILADVHSLSTDHSVTAETAHTDDARGHEKTSRRGGLPGTYRPVLLPDAVGEPEVAVHPQSDAVPPPAETGNRYRIDGEIARGGMGVVLRGRDVDLGRDIAVKVLIDQFADCPEVMRRFIEEAQIGGQLQHPGVVPVYDFGRFGERPFFTMKLVKGQTLATILAKRSAPSAELPRLLGIALKICETMAYAHGKGVIHRDLKPANIMVGAFGEVQVMDWGLAKVLVKGTRAETEPTNSTSQPPDPTARRHPADSRDLTDSRGTETAAGSLLGTPAYMPPEQAQGDLAHLDRRADVFGLGAILCEILTGQPPFVGRSMAEVCRQAAQGNLGAAMARLDACRADSELIALTKQCLAPQAADRPADAQAVTDSLSAYLNGVQERLQIAERERAVAITRASEQAKRRKVQLALATSLVLMLLGAGAVAWWQNAQTTARRETDLRRRIEDEQRATAEKERLARNAEAVAALLNQCNQALRDNDFTKAAVALEAVEQRQRDGGTANESDRIARLTADLALLRELNAVDQFHWTWSDQQFPERAAVAGRIRAAFQHHQTDLDSGAPDAAARIGRSPLRERLAAALDFLLWSEKSAGIRDVLRQVDANPFRDAVRDAVLVDDFGTIRDLLKDLAGGTGEMGSSLSTGFAAFLGEIPALEIDLRRQLLLEALSRQPADLGLLMTLGNSYSPNQPHTIDDRLRWFQAAVAAAPTNTAAHVNLGVALLDKGLVADALRCYHKALKLDPENSIAWNNLGKAFYDQHRLEDAIAAFRKALDFDPRHSHAYFNLGIALQDQKLTDDAIKNFYKAIEYDPHNANPYNNLGIAFNSQGQTEKALASFRRAVQLDPRHAQAYNNLGTTLSAQGQVDEAIACFRKALES
ncbi:MAG: tetratricopeptide repeat protein, partial [Planctomycetes bacterium]|nr:tetratricopeptide repeat protein [Planctomycetota bacterium]